MGFSEKEKEMLKNMTMKERIAYGSTIGKDLKISKFLGDVCKSGILWIQKWVKGGKDEK